MPDNFQVNPETVARIARELGGGKEKKTEAGWVTRCPAHDDKAPSLSLGSGRSGKLVAFCHAGCDFAAVVRAIEERGLLPSRRGERLAKKKESLPAFIWDNSKAGHPAIEKYLKSRGIHLAATPACLRYNEYRGERSVVMPITSPGGPVEAINRIYLDEKGRKTGARMLGPCRGKAVWLSPVSARMIVGEGPETVLSCMAATGLPGIAALSANGLKAIKIPRQVKEINIAVDSDPNRVGQQAALALAERFHGKVRFAIPDDSCFTDSPHKLDFNDLTTDQIRERFNHLVDPTEVDNFDSSAEKQATISIFDEDGRKKTKGTLLLEIGSQYELFHDEIGEGYATFPVDSHHETWPIKSEVFAGHLMDEFFRITQGGVSRSIVSDATDTLRAAARVNGKQHWVFRRAAMAEEKIYIDLCDSSWRAVEVSRDGWKVVSDHGVKFLRNANSLPLPEPVPGGKLEKLWDFLNVRQEDRPLVAGFLVRALHPDGPFFCLSINGEQGTGKSTASKVIRSLVDPSTAMLRPPPKDERDFLAGAVNNWCICYDNLSFMSPWLSDALCRILTGGSFAARTLYSTAEETAIPLARPAILNGIDDLMARPDLADRAIALPLQPIREAARQDEREMWMRFDAVKGEIFGALLDGLSSALRNINRVRLEYRPRMIDAARWATASEEGLGLPSGSFVESYRQNQKDMVVLSLENSPFAAAILELLEDKKQWRGTPKELLAILPNYARDEEAVRSKAWPKNPVWLSRMLTRHAPALRKVGLSVDLSRNSVERIITMAVNNDSMTVESKNLTPHSRVDDTSSTAGHPQNFQENTVITVIPSQDPGNNDGNDSNDDKNRKVLGSRSSEIGSKKQEQNIIEVTI